MCETVEIFVIEDGETTSFDFNVNEPVLCDAFWREVEELHNDAKVKELREFADLLEKAQSENEQKLAGALKEFGITADVDTAVKTLRELAIEAESADACLSSADLYDLEEDSDIERLMWDGGNWTDDFLRLAGKKDYRLVDLCTYAGLFHRAHEHKMKSFKVIREAVGASQANVAEELGVNVRSVKRWESWDWDHIAPDNAWELLNTWKEDQASLVASYFDDRCFEEEPQDEPQTLNDYLIAYVGAKLSYYRNQTEYDAAAKRGEEEPGVQYWRHNAAVREKVIFFEAMDVPYTVELKPMPTTIEEEVYEYNFNYVMERLA